MINGSSVTKDHILSRLSALTGVLVAVVVLQVCYYCYMILQHRDGRSASSVVAEGVSSNPLDLTDRLPTAGVEVGRVERVDKGTKSEEVRGFQSGGEDEDRRLMERKREVDRLLSVEEEEIRLLEQELGETG